MLNIIDSNGKLEKKLLVVTSMRDWGFGVFYAGYAISICTRSLVHIEPAFFSDTVIGEEYVNFKKVIINLTQ